MDDQKRFEVQKIIDALCAPNLRANSYDDTDKMLMRIRDFLPKKYSSLRDFCDLITHPIRKQGLVIEQFENFCCYLKFHLEFSSTKKSLLLYHIPPCVMRHLENQLEKIDPTKLKKILKKSKYQIKEILSENIMENETAAWLIHPEKYEEIGQIFIHLLGTYSFECAYSLEKIIGELFLFLENEKFNIDKTLFYKNKDKLFLFFILLLHRGHYTSEKLQMTGETNITSMYRIRENQFYLEVHLSFPHKENIDFQIPILRTPLISSEWCDESLKINATLGINNLEHPLTINEHFKLCAAIPIKQYARHHRSVYVGRSKLENKTPRTSREQTTQP